MLLVNNAQESPSPPTHNNYPAGFPGPGVENPPANVEDMGLIPGPERFHMPQGN